jgi:SAM-dependent methyltransferase
MTLNAPASGKVLWEQSLWDERNAQHSFQSAEKSHPISQFIRQWGGGKSGACLELGCYPGQFMPGLGEIGYQLNGIDQSPGTPDKLPEWLASLGHRVGHFWQDDVWTFQPNQTFDLVCSFGLIEHFENWSGLIERHIDLCAPGGSVLITAPQFRGCFQWPIRYLADYENLRRHNLDAMRPKSWSGVAERRGCEVLYSGYIGRYLFWADNQPRNWLQQRLVGLASRGNKFANLLPEGTQTFSPYCAVALRKPS